MKRTAVLVACLVALAGCYEPVVRDCTVQCSAATECAAGQHCTQGWCAASETLDCKPPTQTNNPDASQAVEPDAQMQMPMPDARDICEQGCSKGTCIDGVCTIDCSAPGSCPTDVACPVNLPCHVICGDNACAHKVLCSMSLSCMVDCTGDGSCGDEIQCSASACDVTCSGIGSCHRRTKCANSCACDVTCSGAGSCAEVSECPSTTCRVGNGCSSIPTGCDSCP